MLSYCLQRGTACLALLGLGVALVAVPVAAQEPSEADARTHFRVGRAYHESGRFAEAAAEFEAAYRLSRRPALLYNIFIAYRDAGQLEPAARALRSYLELVPDAENRDQLEARLRSMEQVLAEHGPSGEVPAVADPPRESDRAAQGGGTWVPGWIVAGTGGAMMLASIVTGVLTLNQRDQLELEYGCTPTGACQPGFESARDTGVVLAAVTDALVFGGAAIAATGIILALVLADGGSEPPPVSAGFLCGPDGCAGTLRAQF